MTLIEERCEIKSPCASCTRKERCNVGIAQSCPAFKEYASTHVLDRKKAAYRQHLKWMERVCGFKHE